jgi:HSP20 family protein
MAVVYVFTRSAWQPAVDIYQTARGLLLVCEAQGCRPDQLSVTVERRRVILAGVREPPVSAGRWLRGEIAWGAFERAIALPVPVDPEGARAVRRDGLLLVECPFGAAVSTSVRVAVSTRE